MTSQRISQLRHTGWATIALYAAVRLKSSRRDLSLSAWVSGVDVHSWLTVWQVAQTDHGLGLFARAPLRRGTAIVEYYGPRLPLRCAS
jgi:hypothetical protein